MINRQYYFITRQGKEGNVVYFDHQRVKEGFQVTPKNQLQYDGITVKKLVIVKQSFVEKVLKRKIKKRLELYLQYIINIIDADDDEGADGSLNEVLNDLSRYKDIILYKYQQYLGNEYVELMKQKIELLEYELKLKLMKTMTYENVYEEENVNRRSK